MRNAVGYFLPISKRIFFFDSTKGVVVVSSAVGKLSFPVGGAPSPPPPANGLDPSDGNGVSVDSLAIASSFGSSPNGAPIINKRAIASIALPRSPTFNK